MRLTIHRGTKEIGGSCVELKTDDTRILIDFGMPLVDERGERFDSEALNGKSISELKFLKILPEVEGLYRGEDCRVDAIFISHTHLDHYGLLSYVHPDIPVYMSEGAKILADISDIFIPHNIGKINATIIDKRKKIVVGDFVVTSQLVDHSAFDAVAFIVETDGKKIFYSGDFRGHGRKSVLFQKMLETPPKDIDCLLMEGSMLGRSNMLCKNEKAVQESIEDILKSNDNIKFLFASSQNIDRIVSGYKACLKTNHIFVIDIYTAYILDKLSKVSKNIPQFDWKSIKVKFTKYHANALAEKVSKQLLYQYNTNKIDIVDINNRKSKILMLARDNSIFPFFVKGIKDIKGAKIIYSMWEGYLTDKFKMYCADKGMDIVYAHTSGHATPEDLKIFAEAINPKVLIPIHTFHADKYPDIFSNVKILNDKEKYTV
ncbi:MAG: MBL fold metallo-hydrolase [Candidatus Omnitrophica bacterium]|nr:MBL fold metallo-hydrolase [Candidatus Omnitrophota bacterium]